MPRIERLPAGALDIVGDVHGEIDALRDLLRLLGYTARGEHPEQRRLVFLGDLVDRGPDSVAVVTLVRRLVEAGFAQVVLGNHELNLLRGQRKPGNDWLWDEGAHHDAPFVPYARASAEQRAEMLAWFETLPLALHREDLRIVHAAWSDDALRQIDSAQGGVAEMFAAWDAQADAWLASQGWTQRAHQEHAAYVHHYGDSSYPMPMLPAYGYREEQRQMRNPLRVLTSGVERCADAPFYTAHQWRFARRVPWWDEYKGDVPVVVGHFWRQYLPLDRRQLGKGDADLFEGIDPQAWLGPRGRVFCVDYSVGGRYKERAAGSVTRTRLAALRWPERDLVLDDGACVPTVAFGGGTP